MVTSQKVVSFTKDHSKITMNIGFKYIKVTNVQILVEIRFVIISHFEITQIHVLNKLQDTKHFI